jgi:polyphosphate glucokinase
MPKDREMPAKLSPNAKGPRTLAIDIGGTGVKADVLDADGKVIKDRVRLPTPKKATPHKLIAVVRELAKQQGDFERVSAGFPGVIKGGVVYTAANLGKGWNGFDLAKALSKKLKRPVRVANDADVQGLGSVTGHGVELVITLGTGFGSVIFSDGTRLHMELGHSPFHNGKTYEDELGRRALENKGRKKWNKLVQEAIVDLRQTFNFDRLYLGGGNTKFIKFKLPPDVKVVSNEDGLLGGIALWEEYPFRNRPSVPKPKLAAAIAKTAEATAKLAKQKPKSKSESKAAAVMAPHSDSDAAADPPLNAIIEN